MKNYIIGIDAGTTGIRTFCFDTKGKVISVAYEEFKQIFPKAGWVEHNALEISLTNAKQLFYLIKRPANRYITLSSGNVDEPLIFART